ncbi:hypothetical protein RM553_00305 [Zunongwangia sp. F363]|uniref:Uncharacterized protein n=1 Tax=Autumnicola tepida TaxID=3075595 RepID=A0ABU3C4I1_9FLAO|nr:hypothetical protein [Zunongwangia sp. F363]MDT0641258.1 hypothetical protein [Zunongwangia sp. F363]
MKIFRTHSGNPNFISLVKALDADLAVRDGEEHSFYDQFNKLDKIKHVVLLFENEQAVSCGVIKELNQVLWKLNACLPFPFFAEEDLPAKC